ncbi:MAG: hypothetical protein NTZ09_15835 [Candidatus Hydrogenedentes bacterium]|nr:hypothetical protein [Candidatus Hydrogenedentota bacterium]
MATKALAALLATMVCASLASYAGPAEPRRLNNVVTQLAEVESLSGDAESVDFSNPRDGWIFIGVGKAAGAEPRAVIDAAGSALVWRTNPRSGAPEAMVKLPKGAHQLRVEGAQGLRLDVRAIPEIQYCYYPTKPHIAAYGPYDWAYMEKYVLPDVNTIVTRSEVDPDQFAEWLREGRQWLSNASLPGLSNETAPSPDAVYAYWAENSVVTKPGFGGLIVDEFIGASEGHYAAWAEAWGRLHETPGFAGKEFYAWCGNMWDEPASLEFAKKLMKKGDLFVWEQYLREGKDEQDAREEIDRCKSHFAKWKQELPGVEKQMVVCLGYLSAPPESLNLNPSADYQVYLDMQFYALATAPEFDGVYGVMEYMADYADEESLRYAQKLFRHYCIEGNTARFNKDPYLLPHLKNADFADGLDHWRAEPADEGSIDSRSMKGFSWLEGRYPETKQGDTFCWMKRAGEKPNRVLQPLQQLTPGRLYSVKAIAADPAQLDVQKETRIDIEVAGADIVQKFGFSFAYPSCYSHEVEPYSERHPAWFTLHRAVFRATGPTAELAISDRGEAGAETAFNFVEVQPFVEH